MTDDTPRDPPRCYKCGHSSSYHGMTFCTHDFGSGESRTCDCDGFDATRPSGDEAAMKNLVHHGVDYAAYAYTWRDLELELRRTGGRFSHLERAANDDDPMRQWRATAIGPRINDRTAWAHQTDGASAHYALITLVLAIREEGSRD